jgi:apolipoprotein N-acyltransferase
MRVISPQQMSVNRAATYRRRMKCSRGELREFLAEVGHDPMQVQAITLSSASLLRKQDMLTGGLTLAGGLFVLGLGLACSYWIYQSTPLGGHYIVYLGVFIVSGLAVLRGAYKIICGLFW